MQLKQIGLTSIVKNPNQPRKSVEDIENLAASINEIGLINPITVERKGKKYMIVCGERRWHAFKYLKRKKIPAIITKQATYLQMLAENISRQEMNIIEKMEGARVVFEKEFGKDWQTQVHKAKNARFKLIKPSEESNKANKICDSIGMPASSMSTYLSVLDIPKSVQKNIFRNRKYFTDSVIIKLSKLKESKGIESVAERIIRKEMSSKEAFRAISSYHWGDDETARYWESINERWSKHLYSAIRVLGEITQEKKILGGKKNVYLRGARKLKNAADDLIRKHGGKING